jgi:hypothetical protein
MIVKKLGWNWLIWFENNYDKSQLRSVQDYMRIADVPNAIRYAVFGKERILQILKQIGKPTGDDPIGQFLDVNGVEYDPEAETDYKELKIITDIAITHKKLNDAELSDIPSDKIEALVRRGIEITPMLLDQLSLVKSTNGNIAKYVDNLIATGGKVEKITTPAIKAETFKKTLDQFIDKTTDAIKDVEYLGQVDLEICRQLKEKVLALEQKITSMIN